MNTEILSSSCMMKAIECWENSRRKRGVDEKIGIDIMLALFEMNPQAKTHFGFRADQVIDVNNGLHRIGILIHGQRFIQMLDCLFSVLGPDNDTIKGVLLDYNKDSCQDGMPLHQFALLLDALVKVMADMNGEHWTNDLQSSWHHVMRYLQVVIDQNVAKSLSQSQIGKTSAQSLPQSGQGTNAGKPLPQTQNNDKNAAKSSPHTQIIGKKETAKSLPHTQKIAKSLKSSVPIPRERSSRTIVNV